VGATTTGVLAAASRLTNNSHVVQTRAAALFIAPALAVELAAWLFRPERRRLGFLVTSGIGIATLGLAGEYLWNRHAHQPWTLTLMKAAVPLGALVAVGAALLASGLAGGVLREGPRVPRTLVALGALAVLVGLAIPLPRRGGDAQAAIHLQRVGDRALVHVTLTPANAASHARRFHTMSWQGGGLVIANMKAQGAGEYVSDKPLPISGHWKTLVRLHRGAQMLAAPVWMPADPAIGKGSIPAVDRTVAMVREQKYLTREARSGPATFAIFAYVLLTIVAVAWATSFVLAATRPGRGGARRSPTSPAFRGGRRHQPAAA